MNDRYTIIYLLWLAALLIAAAHVMVGYVGGILLAGLLFAVVDIAMAAGVTWWGVRLIRRDEES